MKEAKGITPVISALLLISITVSALGTYYGVIQQTQESAENTVEVPKLVNDLDKVSYDTSWNENGSVKISLSNNAEAPSNVSIWRNNNKYQTSLLRGGERKTFDLGCVNATSKIQISSGGDKRELPVIVEPKYCIDIVETKVSPGLTSEKTWTLEAYQNNRDKTPYANKELSISFDGDTRTLETNDEGRASFSHRWDVQYVPKESMWKREIEYTRSANLMDFHRGSGELQPPNRLRLDFSDGNSQTYQTQEVLKEKESSKMKVRYDIKPLNLESDSIKFQVNTEITAKEGIENDWSSHSSNSDLLYQMTVPSSGGYADINNIDCSAGIDVSCTASKMTQTVESSTEGRKFEKSSLPTSEGKKYMPINMQLTSDDAPFLGSLTSFSYFRYNNGWKRFRVDEREIFVPEGTTGTYTQQAKPDRIDTILENRFDDPGADAERNYRQRIATTSTVGGWLNAPRMARANANFALENTVDYTGNSDTHTIDSITYNWTDIEAGKTYDINFTVELERDPNQDKKFMLPINLGTYGIFPDNGGKAKELYTKGGVRYPPFGQTGSYSFATEIPKQGADQALVYKITIPEEEDRWKAKTYVLNTADSKIENIYLLNSQGKFKEFEGMSSGDLSGGEEIEKKLNIEKNQDKMVQLNMQFQTIDGGLSEDDYPDWDYTSYLNISGETDYNYDISGTVECDKRYCINYRTGNRDEAKRIDSIRGKKAAKSVFTDELDSVRFYMKNGDSSDGAQDLKNLGIWIWYMQPYKNNLESLLNRPDALEVKTTESKIGVKQGELRKVFE